MDLYKEIIKLINFSGNKYKLYPAGSIYRNPSIKNPGDVDIILVTKNIEGILSTYQSSIPTKIIRQGERMASLSVLYKRKWIKVDIWVCTPEEFPFLLLMVGYGKEYVIRIRAVAKKRGYLLNRYGLYERDTGKKIKGKFKTVADIQRRIGVTVN